MSAIAERAAEVVATAQRLAETDQPDERLTIVSQMLQASINVQNDWIAEDADE